MLETQFTLLVVIMVLFVVGVVASVFWVERKHTKKELSDWYDTPADDELTPLLGVVSSPKKKKGDK
jgi:flagellar basal body-associated protein FliL